MKKVIAVVSKKRGLSLGFLCLLVVLIGFNVFWSNEAYGSGGDKLVIVQPGDTLWSIASKNYKGENTQEAIYNIKKANGLKSSNLQIGTELRLPTF